MLSFGSLHFLPGLFLCLLCPFYGSLCPFKGCPCLFLGFICLFLGNGGKPCGLLCLFFRFLGAL